MNSGVSEKFITEFTSSQMVLHAYILFLVGGIEDSKDILQETNLVLCASVFKARHCAGGG